LLIVPTAFFFVSQINLFISSFWIEMKVDKHAVGGCGGIIGRKKGAVAMYINFSGIRMVFVSCHLAG